MLRPTVSDSIAWAADGLRQHDMPPDEIRAVLSADDPELVHRYIELHLERLEERLADQRLTLARLERLLVGATLERGRTPTSLSAPWVDRASG